MFAASNLYAIGWLLAVIGFAVLEGVTIQLVAIWFAIGSLGGLLAALLGFPFTTQLLAFGVLSAIVLAVTRPIVKKRLQSTQVHTNADSIIGMVGVVVQPVDNMQSAGRVHVAGLDWSARSEDGFPIPEGEQVLIKAIEGVKVIVEQI